MENNKMLIDNKMKLYDLLNNLDNKHGHLEGLYEVLSYIFSDNDNNQVPLFFRKQLIALITSFNFMIKDIIEETQKIWDYVNSN